MPRETARKLAQDPSMVHTEVLRGFNGDVSMDTANAQSTSVTSITGTQQVLKFSDLLAYTSASLNITASTGGVSTASLLANGDVVTNTTGGFTTPTLTTTQVQHTNPLDAPEYSVKVDAGTVSAAVTVTRESRL